MITTKILSQNDDTGGVDADVGFTLPDTTPEGRVVRPDQASTEFILTEEGLEFGAGMQRGARIVTPLGEPLRRIAEDIRHQLHDFVHANIRPPTRYGFGSRGAEPVDVDALEASCRQACQELEAIFENRGHGDGLTINVRTLAHRTQSVLEAFLVSLVRRQTTHGISESEMGEVLHECIGVKGELGTTMQQLDAMNAQYQAALMEQYRASLQQAEDSGGSEQ